MSVVTAQFDGDIIRCVSQKFSTTRELKESVSVSDASMYVVVFCNNVRDNTKSSTSPKKGNCRIYSRTPTLPVKGNLANS